MKKILISMPEEVLEEIAHEAAKKGLSAATYIRLIAIERHTQLIVDSVMHRIELHQEEIKRAISNNQEEEKAITSENGLNNKAFKVATQEEMDSLNI